MDSALLPRVKVCCIADPLEADLAIELGADALGLVSAMPSGPGPIDDDTIAEIVARAPPPIATFLLTCRTDAPGIVEQHRRTPASVLQLVDHVPHGDLRELRSELPGIKLVQVIHVTGPEALERAHAASTHVDALLLDSGNPSLAVKELGGTGRTHDWETSRRVVASVGVPVFLAGGLNDFNVRAAIERVRPFGVDLCSSVRTNGRLDREKLARFLAAVRGSRAIEGGRGERI